MNPEGTTRPARKPLEHGPEPDLPLVYSCSGASSAAQMANFLAVRLDRLGAAEMSCIAGVGAEVKSLVRVATSGRPILALDGCPLHCAARILRHHGITPARHYDLHEFGVPKLKHRDFDPAQAEQLLARLLKEVPAPSLPTTKEAA